MIVGIGLGREDGFTSNFDMPGPFTPTQNRVTAENGEQPIRFPNGLLYTRVKGEQRTHSEDEIGKLKIITVVAGQDLHLLLTVENSNGWTRVC